MKIDKQDSIVTQDPNVQRLDPVGASSKASVSSKPQTSGPSDQVELSSQSREIESLTSAVKIAPDIRFDKVSEVKKALESGTYNVRSEQIADKIISGG